MSGLSKIKVSSLVGVDFGCLGISGVGESHSNVYPLGKST